jgi:hypothetical protein
MISFIQGNGVSSNPGQDQTPSVDSELLTRRAFGVERGNPLFSPCKWQECRQAPKNVGNRASSLIRYVSRSPSTS